MKQIWTPFMEKKTKVAYQKAYEVVDYLITSLAAFSERFDIEALFEEEENIGSEHLSEK